jgi:hypothetical protein
MNMEIRTEAMQFLSWEYFFRIFGIVSMQCKSVRRFNKCLHVDLGEVYRSKL